MNDASRGTAAIEAVRGMLTIAHLTFHEARRRKILLAALLFGAAFVTVFAIGFNAIHADVAASTRIPEARKPLMLLFAVMAGLYVANFLIVMTSVLVPVDTVSGEIASGAIQTLATKPLPRASIVLGKWLGCWIILAGYVLLIVGGILVAARVIGGVTPTSVLGGVALIVLEGTLLMTLSIAAGTRLTTLASGVTVFGMYGLAFVGGWMEQIGTLFGQATARYLGIVASLLIPSESLWQLASYQMQPPLMRELQMSPFSPASVPSGWMVVWAAGYVVVALLFAVRQFDRRAL